MDIDDVLHDRQAESRATLIAGTALAHPVETFEKSRQMFRADPDPIVGDLHHHAILQAITAHRTTPTIATVVDRVGEQVREDLRKAVPVGHHQCVRLKVVHELEVAPLREDLHVLDGVLHQVMQVHSRGA